MKWVFLWVLLLFGSGVVARADCVLLLDFPNESAALTGPTKAVLNRIHSVYPRSALSVTGYADLVANPSGNTVLASARAVAVQSYLISTGAALSQISEMSRRDLPDLGGPLPSKRLVQIRVQPCDPAVLQGGSQ